MTSITALAQAAPVASGPGPKSEAAPTSSAQPVAAASQTKTAELFVSPVMNVDPGTGIAVLMVRDGATGQELSQTPTKQALQHYARVQQDAVDASKASPAKDQAAAADK